MSASSNFDRLDAAHAEDPTPGGVQISTAEKAVCTLCFGSGMECMPGKGARRCRCRSVDARLQLLAEARIPQRYRRCSLSNYAPAQGNGSQLRAFNYAFRLVRDYPAVERGLLLMGSCGVGKTHLAVSILRGLVEKGAQCLFYEVGTLLREIQGSYDPASDSRETKILAKVCGAEVLVLDDLGATRPTEWVRDTIMQVIGTRYNDQKLTILTTNYPDDRQLSNEETLQDRIGARLRSRLYEMCQALVVEGDDYRQRSGDLTGVPQGPKCN